MAIKLKKITDWLLLIYIFLLTWQAVYIFDEKIINGFKSQYLTGQLYASEIILWLAAVLCLINLAVEHRPNLANLFKKIFKPAESQPFFSAKRLFILALWSCLAYAGLSIAWSADRSAGFYLWLHFLEGAALLMMILTVRLSRIKILWAIMLSAGLQGGLAIRQFLTQTMPAGKWLGLAYHSAANPGDIVIETVSGRWLRAYGALAHPNILGGCLLLGLIAGFWLGLHYLRSAAKNSNRTRLKFLAILAINLIIAAGLFFSFSRSAWLAGVLALIAALFYSLNRWRQKDCRSLPEKTQLSILILSPLILFSLLAVIYSPLVTTRTDFSNRLEAVSGQDRISQIKESLAIIKKRPVLGVGLNNYTIALAQTRSDQPAYLLQPVHNIYLLIWAELGLIGLAAFGWLLLAAFNLFKYQSRQLQLFLPLAAFMIISLFDHYFWTQYAGIIMIWLSLTLVLNNDNLDIQEIKVP
ncbi:MAG: O-antigen ligase family protein [Patescibacteria group bacterium]